MSRSGEYPIAVGITAFAPKGLGGAVCSKSYTSSVALVEHCRQEHGGGSNDSDANPKGSQDRSPEEPRVTAQQM